MHKIVFFLTASVLTFTVISCGSTAARIDPKGNQGLTTVNDINFKDWQNAAVKSVNSLIQAGVLDRISARKQMDQKLSYRPQVVIMVSRVKNKTQQHVDTNLLTNQIRQSLLQTGKAVTTTAVGADGAEDRATRQVRELENDEMFNQKTVQKDGTAIAPDMSLAGEIIQQRTTQGRTSESYFMFHVTLTDLKTGLAVWENNVEVAKQETKALFGL